MEEQARGRPRLIVLRRVTEEAARAGLAWALHRARRLRPSSGRVETVVVGDVGWQVVDGQLRQGAWDPDHRILWLEQGRPLTLVGELLEDPRQLCDVGRPVPLGAASVREAAQGLPDSRRHPRTPCRLTVSYPDLEPRGAEWLSDVSEGGAFIQSPAPRPRGARLLLRLGGPGGERAVNVCAEVAWTRSHRSPGMGVRFLFSPDSGAPPLAERLTELLRAVSVAGG